MHTQIYVYENKIQSTGCWELIYVKRPNHGIIYRYQIESLLILI